MSKQTIMTRIARWAAIALFALALLIVGAATAAYQLMLPLVPGQPTAAAARPALTYASREAWEADRPRLRQAFVDHVYGRPPPARPVRVIARKTIPAPFLRGEGRLEQWTLGIGEGAGAERLFVLVLTPAGSGPWPAILAPTFCGNRASMPANGSMADIEPDMPSECQSGGLGDLIVPLIFGRNASVPPMLSLVRRGYALVTFYPGDVVPDDRRDAMAALTRLDPEATPAERGGALMAWAWLDSRVLDAVEADPRFDSSRTAVWGHSRHGKSALLAAALDPRFEAVISHQSGRGGASLSRNLQGERIGQITEAYPYWFGARFRSYAGREDQLPIDQHQLIALIAPRSVLLGAGARDAWADPQGAFAALKGADPIWRLYGQPGLKQAGLVEPDNGGRLAMFMRPGRHGIHASDWRMFLDFLDAQWTVSRAPDAATP